MSVLNKKKVLFSLLIISLILGSILIVINISVSSRQGVNYVVHTIRLPLYIKFIEFIDRDYQYKTIARAIIKDCKTDNEKVLAIFYWTRNNIKKGIPSGFPIIDDHVLNIIIRGYGTADQIADVFTTLSSYAGYPAVMYNLYLPDNPEHGLCISAVYLQGKWRLMDAYNGLYFINKNNTIASIDDIIANPNLIEKTIDKSIDKIKYLNMYKNLKPIKEIKTTKAELQMPIKRIIFAIKNKLNLTKKLILFYGR